MSTEVENYKRFGEMFSKRKQLFRLVELSCIPKGLFEYPDAAHRILADMEKCYCAKAYYAAICLATSSIEIFLEQTEKVKGRNFKQLLENSGLLEEVDEFRTLRNDIMHGNENDLIQYDAFDPDGKLELELEILCLKVFKLVHSLPHRLLQGNA